MTRCDSCNNRIGFFSKKFSINDNETYCLECYDKYLQEKKEKKLREEKQKKRKKELR